MYNTLWEAHEVTLVILTFDRVFLILYNVTEGMHNAQAT